MVRLQLNGLVVLVGVWRRVTVWSVFDVAKQHSGLETSQITQWHGLISKAFDIYKDYSTILFRTLKRYVASKR